MIENISSQINSLNAEYIMILILSISVCAMLLNKKVNTSKVFLEQLKVFNNDKTQKISIYDIFCFILCPILLSVVIVLGYDFRINDEFAQSLITAFSLVFTLMLAFETILVGKKSSGNEVEREVIKQTFISAVSTSILSLFGAILTIVLLLTSKYIVTKILTLFVLLISFMIIMLILMIIKRTFIVFLQENEDEDKKNNK